MLAPGSIDAPAKINLTLEILAARTDGFHGIRSVMVPLDLVDRLAWEPSTHFVPLGDLAQIPANRNLVTRAFAALGIAPALRVDLEKAIPVGGGLGGGSSDAAAVLRAAARGAFGAIGAPDYMALARSLGSDVPFFLAETGALVEGTGERVTALGALPSWHVVVVMPPVAVDTREAFAALDDARIVGYEVRPRNASASLAAVAALQRADFESLRSISMNDFEDVIAAREPVIANILDGLRRAGARIARLSGSGACCYALCETRSEALAICERLTPPIGTKVLATALAAQPAWR